MTFIAMFGPHPQPHYDIGHLYWSRKPHPFNNTHQWGTGDLLYGDKVSDLSMYVYYCLLSRALGEDRITNYVTGKML